MPSFVAIGQTLLSYNISAAVMFRDLLTLTFDLLTLDNGHTWLVTCSTWLYDQRKTSYLPK